MKRKRNTIFFVAALAAVSLGMGLSSCAKKDKDNCFSCDAGGGTVKYCYEDGNSFYTATTPSGSVHEIELDGESWATVKAELQAGCN